MDKKTKAKIRRIIGVTLLIALAVSLGYFAYALTTLSWHQNPTVPEGTVNFSTSPSITAGSDQTAQWTYSDAAKSFTMPLTLTNNRNSAWTPTITPTDVPSGWVFSTSTLSAIAANGGTLSVTLTVHYSSGTPVAGPIGDFTVSIN